MVRRIDPIFSRDFPVNKRLFAVIVFAGMRHAVEMRLDAIHVIANQRLYDSPDQLRALIDSGEFLRAGRLPAESELASVGCERGSVREAMIAWK